MRARPRSEESISNEVHAMRRTTQLSVVLREQDPSLTHALTQPPLWMTVSKPLQDRHSERSMRARLRGAKNPIKRSAFDQAYPHN
jgi:hypothetical protein